MPRSTHTRKRRSGLTGTQLEEEYEDFISSHVELRTPSCMYNGNNFQSPLPSHALSGQDGQPSSNLFGVSVPTCPLPPTTGKRAKKTVESLLDKVIKEFSSSDCTVGSLEQRRKTYEMDASSAQMNHPSFDCTSLPRRSLSTLPNSDVPTHFSTRDQATQTNQASVAEGFLPSSLLWDIKHNGPHQRTWTTNAMTEVLPHALHDVVGVGKTNGSLPSPSNVLVQQTVYPNRPATSSTVASTDIHTLCCNRDGSQKDTSASSLHPRSLIRAINEWRNRRTRVMALRLKKIYTPQNLRTVCALPLWSSTNLERHRTLRKSTQTGAVNGIYVPALKICSPLTSVFHALPELAVYSSRVCTHAPGPSSASHVLGDARPSPRLPCRNSSVSRGLFPATGHAAVCARNKKTSTPTRSNATIAGNVRLSSITQASSNDPSSSYHGSASLQAASTCSMRPTCLLQAIGNKLM